MITHHTACVEWSGNRKADGYGRYGQRTAHRLAWESVHGEIPIGLCVLHRCDNRACVNVDHLFLGTNADNVADKVAKDRQHRPKGERNPKAKLSASDVRRIREMQTNNSETARIFGVNNTTISNIRLGKTWKHIR